MILACCHSASQQPLLALMATSWSQKPHTEHAYQRWCVVGCLGRRAHPLPPSSIAHRYKSQVVKDFKFHFYFQSYPGEHRLIIKDALFGAPTFFGVCSPLSQAQKRSCLEILCVNNGINRAGWRCFVFFLFCLTQMKAWNPVLNQLHALMCLLVFRISSVYA